MTWQAGAILLLVAALVGGFTWYERSRPASRIVALVAVLAALAVAGRVALAPIPNVVATTDIALLAGYSLGAAPGFVVGALAAIVSNFWLGQGPWTLWQMIAWGGVGVGGALLARISVRRLGRVGLTLAAGIAGLAYGAFLDFSVMVNFGGEQSLDRYLALSARGLPFNIAHALGNAALMWVAGPSLVAMLARFRERSEVTWADQPELAPGAEGSSPAGGSEDGDGSTGHGPARAAGALGALIVAVALIGASPPERASAATADGARWLAQAQNDDGGFGAAPSDASSVAITGWAALGLEATGQNPLDIGGEDNPIGYLRQNAAELRSTGDLERTALVLGGAGLDPDALGGRDILEQLLDRRRGNGSWEGQVNLTAFGILAQRAAGQSASRVRASASWLRDAQNEDGGWGSRAGAVSEPDSSGAVVQALAVSPGKIARPAVGAGVSYLESAQEPDGGWALTPGAGSNAQSTAWAVQGLEAGGVDSSQVRSDGNSGLAYLDDRQAPNGHYRYSAESDQTPVWVTAQALLALERRPFPVKAVPREPKVEQADSGGQEGSSDDGTDQQGSSSSAGRNGSSGSGGGAGSGSGGSGGGGGEGAATDKSKGEKDNGGGDAGNGDQAGGRDQSEAGAGDSNPNRSAGGGGQAARANASSDDSDETLRRVGFSALAILLAGAAAGVVRYRRRLL